MSKKIFYKNRISNLTVKVKEYIISWIKMLYLKNNVYYIIIVNIM